MSKHRKFQKKNLGAIPKKIQIQPAAEEGCSRADAGNAYSLQRLIHTLPRHQIATESIRLARFPLRRQMFRLSKILSGLLLCCLLLRVTFAPEGRNRFVLKAEADRNYQIQASSDLVNWMTITVAHASAEGVVSFEDPDADRYRARFYRAAYQKTASLASLGFRSDRILVKPKPGSNLGGANVLLGASVVRMFPDLGSVQIVQLPAGKSTADAIAQYQQSGLVEYAEPDYNVKVLAEPNDFRFTDGSLWNLHNTGQNGGTKGADIHATEAWDARTSADNVIVAVIDTGVRYTHEDLAANMWINPGEMAGDGLDNDQDGYVDDVHGINTIANDGDPVDDHGHGSHVAGIIGAVGNNKVGVVGVAWKVQIMACKFINSHGEGTVSDAIICIDYARKHGAKVINASWGGPAFNSQALRDAIANARNAGIIFVAAAGNSGVDNENAAEAVYPASFDLDNIISVLATTRNDEMAFFSNYGATTVDIGAPGLDVFSCWNSSDDSYQYFLGSSMAAAHVTGACALAMANFPNENYRQIIDRILGGADPLPNLAGKCVTGGRLNLKNILGSSGAKPKVSVVASAANAAEADRKPGQFTINRTGDTSSALTVNFDLSGTALNGIDYDRAANSLTIPSGQASANLTITPIDDSEVEGDETVILTLSENAGYTIGTPNTATVTIGDNDSPPPPPPPNPVVTVNASDDSASEAGPDTGEFSIARNGDTSAALAVNFSLTGSAVNGTDYSPLSTTATIPAGSNSVTVKVEPIDDTIVEGDETVILTLSESAGYTIGPPNTATVTIKDNDSPPPPVAADFTATPTSGQAPLNVQFTDKSTGPVARWDWNFGDASAQSAIQNPSHVFKVAGDFTVTLTVSSINSSSKSATIHVTAPPPPPPPAPVVTVEATDATATEGGSDNGAFTIRRSGSTVSPLVVHYIMGDQAQNGVDYQSLSGSVTIPAGSVSATVNVIPIDDSVVEANEPVLLTLVGSTGSSYVLGQPDRATVTIFDNDGASGRPTITVTASDPVASESGDIGTFTILRSSSTATPVTIRYTMGEEAKNGIDYQTLSGSVTIPAGAGSVKINVVPINDSLIESDEPVMLMLFGYAGAPYIVGKPDGATLTIVDNDKLPVRPTVTVVASDPTASESGDTGTFTIKCTPSAPTALTVRYTMGEQAKNGVDYQMLAGTATIPAGASSVDVKLIPINDSLHESNEPAMLMLYGYTGAPYIVGTPNGATVTILDND